jgi:hypothetical protein
VLCLEIALFAITTTGDTPTTTNSTWTAESVTAGTWGSPMGTSLASWQQYTGLSYTQAFPSNPTKLNGYFLNYTFNSGADTISFPGNPVIPGASLGGFFFQGSPSKISIARHFCVGVSMESTT